MLDREGEPLPPARRLQKGVVRNPCTQGWGDNAVSKMPAHTHEDLSVSLRHMGVRGQAGSGPGDGSAVKVLAMQTKSQSSDLWNPSLSLFPVAG